MPPSEEFFYLDESGKKQDAGLHNPIIAAGERRLGLRPPIDEKIMGPIRKRNRAKWLALHAKADASRTHTTRMEYVEDEHPRDEHGRWTDGGGSERGGGGKTAGGGSGGGTAVEHFTPGLKSTDTTTAKSVKRSWFAASPFKTVDDVVAAAPAAQDELARVGERIASKLGVEFKNPGVKTKDQSGIDRVKVKMAMRGGNVAEITDVARAAFVIDKPGQSDEIAAELAKHFEVALEGWKRTEVNYLDRTLVVRLASGMTAEVQMMDRTMADAKSAKEGGGGGHDLYVQWRELRPADNPAEREKYERLLQAQRDLYGGVIERYDADWKAVAGKSGK